MFFLNASACALTAGCESLLIDIILFKALSDISYGVNPLLEVV